MTMPSSSRKRPRAPLPFLAAVFLCSAANAAYTMLLDGGIAETLKALGGTGAYSAKAEVNGRDAEVAAAGFDGRSPRSVASEHAAELGLPHGAAALGEGVVAAAGKDGEQLLLVPDGKGGSVAWVVTLAKNGAPRNPDAKNGAPLSPLAEPVFRATNKASGAMLAVGTTPVPPEAARASQGAHLAAQGWTGVELGGDSGLDIYVRGEGVCVVWAGTDPVTGATRLAVIQR